MEFRKLTDNQIVERLKFISDAENIKIEDNALLEIAKSSNGGLRDAIGLLEKVSTYKTTNIEIDDVRTISNNISYKELEEFKELFLDKNINELINKINKYYDDGVDLSRIVYSLIDQLTTELITNKSNSNTSSIVFKLDELLSNMNKSENPKLIMEVALLNILSENKIETHSIVETPKTVSVPIIENPINNKETEMKVKLLATNNDEIKNIRIGNTLSRAKREYLDPFKKGWKNINDLAFDSNYGNIARLLVSDIAPAAASDEYIILKSKLVGISESINNDLLSVETIFNKVFNLNYKAICVSETEWNEKIEEYKKDKSVFTYQQEIAKKKEKEEKNLKEKAKELFDI